MFSFTFGDSLLLHIFVLLVFSASANVYFHLQHLHVMMGSKCIGIPNSNCLFSARLVWYKFYHVNTLPHRNVQRKHCDLPQSISLSSKPDQKPIYAPLLTLLVRHHCIYVLPNTELYSKQVAACHRVKQNVTRLILGRCI